MSLELKTKVLKVLIEQIENKIAQLDLTISEIKASRNDNTKSSAGDKYETARAMMQIELEKNETQRQKSRELLKHLNQIDLGKKHTQVDFGSFVESQNNFFFMAIGYGKLVVEDKTILVISLASPIGKALKSSKNGNVIKSQNQVIEIKSIY
jgi:transcription elongation GreA/GreB family factor